MTDLSRVNSKIVEFPRSMEERFWTKEMREHARLVAEETRLAALAMTVSGHATAIRERGETLDASCERLRHLPASTRARMAVRAAIQKVQSPKKKAPTPLELLETEAKCLAEERTRRASDIQEIERRILLQKPTSASDVQTLLRFVTKLLESGRSVDLRPIVKALDHAARQSHPANAPAKTARPKPSH